MNIGISRLLAGLLQNFQRRGFFERSLKRRVPLAIASVEHVNNASALQP